MIFGPLSQDVLNSAESTSIAIAASDGTTAVYSKSFSLAYARDMALKGAFTVTTGSVNVKVQLQIGLAVPTTEGAADASWVMHSTLKTVTDENSFAVPMAPAPLAFARYVFTGLTGNHASNTFRGYYTRQEEM